MRGTRAKEIRKRIYGDKSIRARRYMKDENGTVTNMGLRKAYQHEKQDYQREKGR